MILPILLVVALFCMSGAAIALLAYNPTKAEKPKPVTSPLPQEIVAEPMRQLSRRDEELEDDLFYIKEEVRNNEYKQRREAALKRLEAIKMGATSTP